MTDSVATEARADEADQAEGDPDSGEPAVDAGAATAFSLGWQAARIYARAKPREPLPPIDGKRLPGIGSLPRGVRSEVHIAQLDAGLELLAGRLKPAGVKKPETEDLKKVLFDGDRAAIRTAVYELHIGVLGRLLAADYRLGTAYGLGRALADTCYATTEAELRERFSDFRIRQLQEWLADLESALPAHSARATAFGLTEWRLWLAERQDRTGDVDRDLRARMIRQGRLWRALLSGEKRGTEMLAPENYIDAANRLLKRTRSILRILGRRYRDALSALGLVFFVGFTVAVIVPGTGSAIAGIGAAAAALGISWKGVGSVLAGLTADLRAPMWTAELDHAIAEAVSCLPGDSVAIQPSRTPPSGPTMAGGTDEEGA